jgi:hypothetical protein
VNRTGHWSGYHHNPIATPNDMVSTNATSQATVLRILGGTQRRTLTNVEVVPESSKRKWLCCVGFVVEFVFL